jgi:hypothetical protein
MACTLTSFQTAAVFGQLGKTEPSVPRNPSAKTRTLENSSPPVANSSLSDVKPPWRPLNTEPLDL